MNTALRLCWALMTVSGLVIATTPSPLAGGASTGPEELVVQKRVPQLGEKSCTYGPSYWCTNITNAASCNAVKHCIQSTWETQKYPEDNDDICTICKNMVKEARDTLTSNMTLDELKQVFDGSCDLLPLKVVKTECKKLADDFIPELVDTLASQMDPNVVCTVSGLCNNERIDKLLLENKKQVQSEVPSQYSDCEQCAIAMKKGEILVQKMSKDDIINKVLMICGELSSYSDSCSSIVLMYNNEIYYALKNFFSIRNVCMLSGMCADAFHPHADDYVRSNNILMGVEINNAGERGRVEMKKPKVTDDLTCQFCDAMVKHLRDVLISNTTEEQFLDVLKGLCEQTRSFSKECLETVNNNYARIYKFLLTELNGKVLCSIVGICPNTRYSLDFIVPSYPLIPIQLLQPQKAIKTEEVNSFDVQDKQNKQNPSIVVVDEQPPKVTNIKKSPVIDVFYSETHFVVNDVAMPTEKTACFLCQSVLHYVQQVVTDPTSEAEIRSALEKSCVIVPSSLEPQCKQFVDQYGDAFIALLAQEADPSTICPELKLCPSTDVSLALDKNIESSKNCPMCVVFMSALESEISNKDTEAELKKKLEKLCTKLPSKWKAECTDFVSGQLESILDMLVAQVTPQEICILLNVCDPKIQTAGNEIDSNMVIKTEQVTVVLPGYNMGQLLANNYQMLEKPKVPTPFCLICTVVMKYLNSEVKDKSNQDEIEHVMDSVCRVLPNVEENECQTFVDSNYQQIMKVIQIGTDPGIACMALLVCDDVMVGGKEDTDIMTKSVTTKSVELDTDIMTKSVTTKSVELDTTNECVACEAFVSVFDDRLKNNSVDINEVDLMELCYEVETNYKDQCLEMIESYDQTFKNLVNQIPTWMMCEKMSLCSKNKSVAVNQLKNAKCLEDSKYWCASKVNAKECKAESLCERTSWTVKVVEN